MMMPTFLEPHLEHRRRGRQIRVHCPVIRPELVAELQEIETRVMAACRTMAVNRDALAFVYAVLDGVALHGEGV
jgi:hypothetical protein